jgi:formate/nitrite transporter FocA (FNT family)
MGMALTLSPEFPSPLVKQATLAALSSVGFLFVVLGQTELFTAHTTMAVLPALDGRTSVREVGRLWGNVYVSNLLGCTAFAAFVAVLGPALGIVTPAAATSLATALVDHPWWVVLLSGVVAGWLMGLMTWLVAATRDTVSRVLIIVIVAAAIGFAPFHHALLGTTEVLSALFLGRGVTLAEYGHFLLWTTLGNVVGGSVLVALVNYGHVALAGETVDVDFETSADGDGGR